MSQIARQLPDLTGEQARIKTWLATATLTPPECDCITAVMLKILDGKCKMPAHEKIIMEALYRETRQLPGHHLQASYHRFIAPFLNVIRTDIEEEKILAIYEQRVLAETKISRPVMKKFKGRLRAEGVLPQKNQAADEDD